MKKCSKCNKLKYKSQFYKDERYKDSCYPSCKQCKDTITNLWRLNNYDRFKEVKKCYNKKVNLRHPRTHYISNLGYKYMKNLRFKRKLRKIFNKAKIKNLEGGVHL